MRLQRGLGLSGLRRQGRQEKRGGGERLGAIGTNGEGFLGR